MRLVIVRHGKAEADSESGRDEDRRLRKRGERQARWLGEYFRARAPALILTSGHERARATATIIHERTGVPLTIERRLELGHSASHALDAVADHQTSDDGGLMVVGHNPQLGQLVWILTQGPPVESASLRTGEAVELEIDPADPLGRAALLARVRLDED